MIPPEIEKPHLTQADLKLGRLFCRGRKILFLAVVLYIALRALTAQADTIKLGTEGAFAPYTFIDKSGALVGFDIDLGNAICTRAHLECTWVINEWDTIIDGLIARDYDAILAGMANTAKRRERVSFSNGYENGDSAGIYIGRDSFQNPATATIAVQANTIFASHLLAKGYLVKTYPTAGAALDAVLNRQADLVFGSPSHFESYIRSGKYSLSLIRREDVAAGPASIAFRKDDNALRARFNAALAAMRIDNTLQQLRQKWFGANIDT